MKILGGFLVLAIMVVGCATLGQRSSKVDLAAIEELQIGKTTGTDLRTKFGDPEQVISLSKNEDTWFYVDHRATEPFQRMSFVLDKEKNVLLTATWIPDERDAFSLKDAALAHFKSASFQIKEIGWVARHEYSDEAVYSNPGLGISIRVNQTSNSVIAIGFGGNRLQPLAKQE